MRGVKLIFCGGVFVVFIVAALLARVVFLFASSARQKRTVIGLMQISARVLLRVLGITIQAPKSFPSLPEQGCFLVSNHQSYLDILVLVAHFPVQFVAKQEVAAWPLLGWMAKLGHTIFIARGSTRHSWQGAQTVMAALRQGIHVLVFPEGTSTNGCAVLPFKPLLFCAAHKSGSPVLPITLHYTAINEQPLNAQTRDLCCWHGEMEFVRHFWKVLSLQSIAVFLEAHEMLTPPYNIAVPELAQRAHEKVAQRFTTAAASTSTKAEPIDTTSEFLLGAVLMSLVNHESYSFEEGDYGEA